MVLSCMCSVSTERNLLVALLLVCWHSGLLLIILTEANFWRVSQIAAAKSVQMTSCWTSCSCLASVGPELEWSLGCA